MKEIIKILRRFHHGKHLNNNRNSWQSRKVKDHFYEMENFFWKIDVSGWDNEKFIEELNPQKDWCEEHFLERVGGNPVNPPPSHNKWNIKTQEYMMDGNKFSHTYPERFWPKSLIHKGIRFNTADYDTLKEILKKDLHTRQAFLPIFFNEDLTASLEDQRVPCTIGYYFYYSNDKLNCNYVIRSIDVIRHLSNDLYLTFLLLQDLSNRIGVNKGNITLMAFNIHCFENDGYILKKRMKDEN